jgi:transposase
LGKKHKSKKRTGKMRLTDFDLKQMDEKYLAARTQEQLMRLSARLLEDLKEARDRLNRTPGNSSMPPSSQAPWDRPGAQPDEADEDETAPGVEQAVELAPEVDVTQGQQEPMDRPDAVSESVTIEQAPAHKRAPGRQPGAQGHGRTQHIEPTQHTEHRPAYCASCGEGWKIQTPAKAYAAYDEIDLAQREPGELGMRLSCTRHALYAMTCGCGHQTRAQLYRADEEALWDSVELGQWRLVGPRLAALIVYFGLRMRLSHERIKELLWELFGLALSKGTIGKTIREAGRAAAPLLDEIAAEIEAAELVHADETSWPEAGKLLWLWTLVTQHAVLFVVGLRNSEMIDNVLGHAFKGTLMSDGYSVYRRFLNRLRCWAHLSRKLRGLADSTDSRVAKIGGELHSRFLALQNAVYAARASPELPPPSVMYAADIACFKALCEQHHDDRHDGVRAVVREFLLDWGTQPIELFRPKTPQVGGRTLSTSTAHLPDVIHNCNPSPADL